MNSLRNLSMITLTSIVLLSIAGIVFAIYGRWTGALILLFGALVVSVLTSLFLARYVSHNARTGERGARIVTQKLSARVNKAIEQQASATDKLHSLVETVREAQTESDSLNQTFQNEVKANMSKLEDNITQFSKLATDLAKTAKRHTTSEVRDSTRQMESLVHIYQRYPEVKLPMPNSGGWAIDSQALAHMITLIEERQPQRILELGSGTSTIWVGYLCRKFGGRLVTLDHLEHYLGLTRTAIDRHQLDDVIESRLAPLEAIDCNGTTFEWYALGSLEDLHTIDMVIIDGPPAATGPQARYPALPKVFKHLAPNVTILLDDAHRADEAEIVESWLREYPEFREIERGTSRLAVLERTTR